MELLRFFIDSGFAWYQLVRFVMTNLIMAVLLFRRLPNNETDRFRRALGYFCLTIVLPIYLIPNRVNSVPLRFLLHFFNVFGFLYFVKKPGWKRALYFAGIWQILHTITVDINMTPLFTMLRWGEVPTDSYFVNMCLSLVVEYLILGSVCWLFQHFVDLRQIYVERLNAAVVIFFNILLQYEKFSLKAWSLQRENASPELTVYPIAISLMMLFSIIFFHRYLVTREERERFHIQAAISSMQLENAQAMETAEKDIRRLHHDMKNHLLAIQAISADREKVMDYTGSLLNSMTSYGSLPETGNKILNGLLAEKLRAARSLPASINIYVDLKDVTFLDPIDICIIFGNAVDNALEAVKLVPDPKERIISIRSGAFANTLVLDFSNPYVRAVSFDETGLPRSSKREPWHGIGLSSVRRAVEKYDGTLAIDTSFEDQFRLHIMIPFPE